MSTIEFNGVRKAFPDGSVAVEQFDLKVEDGEFLVLVGPSGCGKTTTLRMLAGLEGVSDGAILLDGEDVTYARPHERDIAMIFQNYALYPHMTVAENVGVPLRLRRIAKSERNRRVAEVLELLELDRVAHRRPSELSGGQRQRVAMGRAIVRRPRVFLMDEPLSNLDARLRNQVRKEIVRIQQSLGTTTVYVTHDQVEAMTMASRMVVMNAGRIEQTGVPEQVYAEPCTPFVGKFLGMPPMNLLSAEIEPIAGGRAIKIGESASIVRHFDAVGQRLIGFRPERVTLHHHTKGTPFDGDGLHLEGEVTTIEYLGAEQLVYVSVNGYDSEEIVVKRTIASTSLSVNDKVACTIAAGDLHVFES